MRGETYQGNPCKRGHDGTRYKKDKHCVECSIAKSSKWNSENPEKVKAIDRKRYHKNPEKRKAGCNKWKSENQDRVKYLNDRWYSQNTEKSSKNSRTWRIKNHYRAVEFDRTRSKTPERKATQRAGLKKHRALKSGAAICDFTHAQWVALQEAFNHCCAYCGKKAKGHLTQDHITPLSKGGNHTLSNIVPACQSCNSKKGTKSPLLPVQPLLLVVSL